MGLIFGPDLVYSKDQKDWVAKPRSSADPAFRGKKAENIVKYLKNTYHVLFSRAMKGCYVYFVDKDTKEYFLSRIEPELL